MWGRSCLFDIQKQPIYTTKAARSRAQSSLLDKSKSVCCNIINASLTNKSCPFIRQKQPADFAIVARLQRQRAAFTLQSQPFQRVKGLLLQAQKAAPAIQEDCFCISPTYLSPSHTAHSSLHIPHFSFPTPPISRFTFYISHSPHCPFLTSHSTFPTSHSSFHIPKIRGFAKWSGCKKNRTSTPYVVIFI